MTHETGPLQSQDSNERLHATLNNTLASTPWAQDMFTEASALQEDFFRYVARPDTSGAEADIAYEAILDRLVDVTRTEIRDGAEYAWALKDTPATIVVSNHLGIGGVGYVDNSDNSFNYPQTRIEGFPLGMLPGFLISKLHTGNLQTDIRAEDKGGLGEIRRKLHGIVIPESVTNGRTDAIVSAVGKMATAGERRVFLFFPEGRTSGWANNGGPYDLDAFRAGTFVIGCKTGIPILPVCQYFDPERGLDLLVLPPMALDETDLERVNSIKDATRQAMQAKLDERLLG